MPKRITILDPNGVEVAQVTDANQEAADHLEAWEFATSEACQDLYKALKRENPKLGTYTVTVKEVE